MTVELGSLLLQGGNLALLGIVLGWLFRLAWRLGPTLERAVVGLAGATAAFSALETRIEALAGRGVCPLLERRGRQTDPETAGGASPEDAA